MEYGDGWYPFFTAGLSTAVTRTGELAGEADVAAAMAELARLSEARGRPRPPEVFLGGISGPGGSREPAALREAIERYRALGVAGVTVSFPARSRRDWRAQAERFATEVLADLAP
ncbi:MAG: hypothetical protein KatS3mg124_0724 [Porticoccaceae bacterium]|nr:MAG: hypothetical protein KatS3mg124_0724 [Porticoccaceae bacterium]